MIKVAFWGDTCLQHKDLIARSWQEPEALHSSVTELVQDIDYSIANLENPLFYDERTRNKEKLALHASPKTIELLKTLKVGAVSLANNHVADYGAKCGLATIKLLEEEGIKWFGAGYAGSEGNPSIIEWDGVSFACLGYSHPPCEECYSASDRFGSARYSREELRSLISDLREKVDYIFVFVHWGLEDINYPVPENVKTGREIIRLGADAVIGSHPHVYQGYEIYKGKYILYSLGNFIFGDIIDAPTEGGLTFTRKQSLRNRIGLVPVFSIDKAGIQLDEIHFFNFRKDNTIIRLTGLKAWLNSLYLRRLSSKLKPDLDDYECWWRRNIKWLYFLRFLEQAALKGTDFRPGRRHYRILKKLITRDSYSFNRDAT